MYDRAVFLRSQKKMFIHPVIFLSLDYQSEHDISSQNILHTFQHL